MLQLPQIPVLSRLTVLHTIQTQHFSFHPRLRPLSPHFLRKELFLCQMLPVLRKFPSLRQLPLILCFLLSLRFLLPLPGHHRHQIRRCPLRGLRILPPPRFSLLFHLRVWGAQVRGLHLSALLLCIPLRLPSRVRRRGSSPLLRREWRRSQAGHRLPLRPRRPSLLESLPLPVPLLYPHSSRSPFSLRFHRVFHLPRCHQRCHHQALLRTSPLLSRFPHPS